MAQPPQSPQLGTPEDQEQQIQIQRAFALNIASFLRDNKILKQRTGELHGTAGSVTFFKFKRAERALLSDEYKQLASNPKNKLPLIESSDEAKAAFVLLIKSQLVGPAQKLHTSQARAANLKPKKGCPCFMQSSRAELTPGEYYIWRYKKKTIKEIALGVGVLVGIMTLILFPLWPMFMRQGVVLLSQFVLGLFALLIVLAIVRLILYILSLPVLTKGFWLFPNLFADVGFFDSFKPWYGFDEEKKKKKRRSKKGPIKSNGTDGTNGIVENVENVEKVESQATKTQTTSAKPSVSTTVRRKGVVLEEVDE